MRAAAVVVVLLSSGCSGLCNARAYDACNVLMYPTMTPDDLATPHELRVQQTVEGTSRGLK